MKKTAILLMILGLSLIPGTSYAKHGPHGETRKTIRQEVKEHVRQQKEENRTFRQRIKDLNIQERAQATLTHRNQQYGENVAYFERQYQKAKAALQDKLAENNHWGENEKAERIKRLGGYAIRKKNIPQPAAR